MSDWIKVALIPAIISAVISVVVGGGIIPSPGGQNRWAQSLRPMDMMSQGRSVSLFHAAQQ